jgi:hypothetical protein
VDEQDLPERLKNRLRDDGYQNRVSWIGMMVSLLGGGHRRIVHAAKKYPDETLEAVLQDDARSCAAAARCYEGEDLAVLVHRVFHGGDFFSWVELAKARPEMAETIQEKLIFAFEATRPNTSVRTIMHLEDLLREIDNTNPVPVLNCFLGGFEDRLVEITAQLPNRINLFTTIGMLLLKGKDPIGRHLARLCERCPGALSMLETSLLSIGCTPGRFIAVCAAVPGLDLDKMEEYVMTHNWGPTLQRSFCGEVKRDRGPLRDVLMVEKIMEC